MGQGAFSAVRNAALNLSFVHRQMFVKRPDEQTQYSLCVMSREHFQPHARITSNLLEVLFIEIIFYVQLKAHNWNNATCGGINIWSKFKAKASKTWIEAKRLSQQNFSQHKIISHLITISCQAPVKPEGGKKHLPRRKIHHRKFDFGHFSESVIAEPSEKFPQLIFFRVCGRRKKLTKIFKWRHNEFNIQMESKHRNESIPKHTHTCRVKAQDRIVLGCPATKYRTRASKKCVFSLFLKLIVKRRRFYFCFKVVRYSYSFCLGLNAVKLVHSPSWGKPRRWKRNLVRCGCRTLKQN